MNVARSRRVARVSLLVLAGLAASLALAEIAVRVWLRARGAPYDAAAVEARLVQIRNPMRAFVPGADASKESAARPRPVLNPYWGSEDEPDSGRVFAHLQSEQREHDYTILVTGGSVAASFAILESPAIARELERDPRFAGRRVVVLNAAHAAHKQPQQLNRVALVFALGGRIDAVVEIDGFNEVVGPLENRREGRHPAWPGAPTWYAALRRVAVSPPERAAAAARLVATSDEAHRVVGTCLRYDLHRSALLGTLAIRRLNALSARRNELQSVVATIGASGSERDRREEAGPPYSGTPRDALELGVRIWAECSKSLDRLCDARGVAYLHVLQPALHDEGAKPMSADERAIRVPCVEWTEGAREGYPLLREAGQLLAADGVHFLDTSRAFERVEETLFVDPCHLGRRGYELLRELVVRGFLDAVVPR